MYDIPTIERCYRGSQELFKEQLKRISDTELAGKSSQTLVHEFTENHGLPFVQLEIKPDQQPVVRKESDGAQLELPVTNSGSGTLRLLQQTRINTSTWSLSFSPMRVKANFDAKTIAYPTGLGESDVKDTNKMLQNYINCLNSDICNETPVFLNRLDSLALRAIEKAKTNLDRNKDLESKTGFRVIDET
ncbi:MAG: hypothetical protein O7G85_07930 [Planctomycetota bacterium]|nr:hypothetical protein [Planctomycetota bacterium]